MHSFFKSFTYARAGILFCLRQRNFKIQSVCAAICIGLCLYLQVEKHDFLMIGFLCLLVLVLEMINTALEHLCNVYSTEISPEIKIVKDVAAGAVLVASIFSLIMGIIIFTPYILLKFNL